MERRRATVFFANALGDQLLALPALRALGAVLSAERQLLLGEGVYSFLYRGLPFGEAACAPWDNDTLQVLEIDRIVRHAYPCDLFISLSTWASPSLLELAQRLGAARIIGLARELPEPVPYDPSAHMFDRLFAVPRYLDSSLCIDDYLAAPILSAAAEAAAARLAGGHRQPGERLLFIHPETKPEKMWTREGFEWVLGRFLDKHPEYRVWLVSHQPYPLELGKHQDRCITGFLHLELAYALMRHIDLFLGIDSCFLHAADLFRVPGVALFGPADPSIWGPSVWGFRLSARSASVSGGGSMDNIRPAAVLDALLRVAEEERTVRCNHGV